MTLERLKELAGKATPGPWRYAVRKKDGSIWLEMGEFEKTPRHSRSDFYGFEEDAELIVASHNALPLLLEVAEAALAVEASATAAYNARRMNVSRNKFDVLAAALAKLEEGGRADEAS